MSISAEFLYHLPEDLDPAFRERAEAEAPEVYTQYLNWLVQLSTEEVRAVEGSAPFLEEYYREAERAWSEWQEEQGIDLAVDDPPEDADVLDAQWQESTAPVPAEQVLRWARRWREIWSADVFPDAVAGVMAEWSGYSDRIVEALSLVERQAECAGRYGLRLQFRLF